MLKRKELLLVAVLVVAGCASAGSGPRPRQDVITAQEIEAARVSNLYELVQRLRPRWLELRSPQSFTSMTQIVVFQGQSYLGGIEMLRQFGNDLGFDIPLRWLESNRLTTQVAFALVYLGLTEEAQAHGVPEPRSLRVGDSFRLLPGAAITLIKPVRDVVRRFWGAQFEVLETVVGLAGAMVRRHAALCFDDVAEDPGGGAVRAGAHRRPHDPRRGGRLAGGGVRRLDEVALDTQPTKSAGEQQRDGQGECHLPAQRPS